MMFFSEIDYTDQIEFTDVNVLDDFDIPRVRNSCDNIVNTYGRKLLEFCKNNKMFILNGRLGNDRVGKPTTK